MSELQQIQKRFINHLLDPESKEIYEFTVGTDKVPLETRLSIYSNAYRWRLLEALANNYPILKAYLGDDEFAELAYAYIDIHPSNFRSIRWFGNQLPNFLKTQEKYSAQTHLAELATLEWTMTLTFDAADAPSLDIETMAAIAPENWPSLQFNFHPAVKRIDFAWNIVALWQAITDERELPELQQSKNLVPWLCWRKDNINQFCSLPIDEAWALDAALVGKNFAEICVGLCEFVSEAEAPMKAASLLKGWIASGLISKVLT